MVRCHYCQGLLLAIKNKAAVAVQRGLPVSISV